MGLGEFGLSLGGGSLSNRIVIYRSARGVQILVKPGKKGQFDFMVSYREPGKRIRTPKHIHLIIDLYLKLAGDPENAMKLIDHIIDIILKIKPAAGFPPKLELFSESDVSRFESLDKYGEYSTEFLLVVTELIMKQEKTNYPNGNMNLRLFRKFRERADIFSVVSAATFGRVRPGI